MLFTILPGLVITGFYSVYFVSLLENLGEIGVLPKNLVTALKTKFGLQKLINKDKNKENEKKP